MKVFVTVGVIIGTLGIVLGLMLGAIVPVLPPGDRERHPVPDRRQSVGPVGALPDRAAVEDRPVRSAGDRPHRFGAELPGDALSGVEGGEHRPRAGAAL